MTTRYAMIFMLFAACTTDVGQPTFQEALNAAVKDPELLATACKRPIPDLEAVRAPFETTFSDFSSSRSVFGSEGTGKVSFVFKAKEGAPCAADMTFSFRQDATMKKFSRRNVTYSSTIELTDVVVTPK